MVFNIPVFDDPAFNQTTTLDGVPYRLSFRYSQRERVYFLTISLDDGTVLASGLKLICDRPILGAGRVDPRLPPGELIAFAVGPDNNPPGLGEIGQDARVNLIYIDASEFRRIPLVGNS